jgi:hypothetical protein
VDFPVTRQIMQLLGIDQFDHYRDGYERDTEREKQSKKHYTHTIHFLHWTTHHQSTKALGFSGIVKLETYHEYS